MNFFAILMFLLKYGPSIFQLIKAALDLIKWLRENDVDAKEFADAEPIKMKLDGMAKRCRKSRDRSELANYVEQLRKRKAEVEAKRKAGG